ncbi:DUF2254 domain-containing protein [Martelella mediterranea]|uniref:Putative membrane protein n=1 Tax=Martelella mediterranea TaxID=293089 RepID=A0A4V2V464_9HYPH|nr:DUF2254 domain-containing protein [Martelella mediterranea]TCT37645.1 putative membrane protein [Martelella mediterranea]
MKLEMSRRLWVISQTMRQIWFVAAIYCVAGIVTALIGIMLNPYIPPGIGRTIGANSVSSLLTIIASSMLTVLIFSLNTVVQATSAAASSATPRAVGTLLEDRTAQSALSTFLGSFIFSLVGLVALNTNLYGDGGRLVLFIATLAVIVLIVIILLRWINYLGRLGKISRTIEQVEGSASTSMHNYRRNPYLGGKPFDGKLPAGLHMIELDKIGYLRFVDISTLDTVAEQLDADIYILERAGAMVAPGRYVAGLLLKEGQSLPDEETLETLHHAFTVGNERSYTQDPLYGLTVLSQVAVRALSPAVNDPGTAIDVLGHLIRVMVEGKKLEPQDEPSHPRIHVREIEAVDFFDAAFTAISRDGAGMAEVGIHLQHAFHALKVVPLEGYEEAADAFSSVALERARETLAFRSDIERLDSLVQGHNTARHILQRNK